MTYNADDYEINELIEHIGLTKPFTREQFGKTMERLLNVLSNSGKTDQMQFYRDIEERIIEEYLDEQEEGDLVIGQPSFKMPNVVKKRHTITINSDKRANRTESTSSFGWQLADEIDNVKQISIESYNIPKSWNNITSSVGNHIFGISYEQPIKFYFDGSYSIAEEEIALKAMSPANFTSLADWFGENTYASTVGAGVMRSTTGRELTAFPSDLSDYDWTVSHNGTNYAISSTSHSSSSIQLMDTTPFPISLTELGASATAYKNSYVEVTGGTPYDINLADLQTITLVKGTNSQVIDFSLQVLLTQAELQANNENYYRWYHQIDPVVTDGEPEQLTFGELLTITVTENGNGKVTQFTTQTAEPRTFEVKPPRVFTIKTTSPTFSYIGIKTDGPITSMRETGNNIITFMIKNADVTESETIGTGDMAGVYATDLSHDMIVSFLNSRQPKDFYERTTPDIRGRTGGLDVANIADYRNLRHTYETRLNNYEPNNLIKTNTYETWSSFKEFIFADNSMNVGTNMLKEDLPDIWEDISNVSFEVTQDGEWTVNSVDNKYTFLLQKIDNNYELTLTPEKRQYTHIYFRIKDGHYGTFSSILSTMNSMSPKTQYDKYLGDGTNTKVNMTALETMLDYVIDTAIGIPSSNGITSHDMIRNAYKNDYGTTFFNTIDWNFAKDPETQNEKLMLSSIGGTDETIPVQLIMYDPSMIDVFKGATLCGNVGSSDLSVQIEPKNTLCNKILGLFNGIDRNETYLLGPETAAPATRKRPDLRRVRNLNIMLIDYKNYAYASNATQRDPSNPNDDKLKTPWYYNEVVFDTSCTQQEGAFIEDAVPIYTASASRQLTEAQIYSLNAIFESQEKKSTTVQLNYKYRDYFLYGIGIRDKPEIGSSANDGIMATYDSKKGKRVYTQPTRLTKFYLELVDQDYYPIDLNGIDIELVLNIDTELNTNK